jgi:MFS superfamily sulfate permease-like transporter
VPAGAVVNFFSETVLVGFKCGVAFFLASTQLPKLFGFGGPHARVPGCSAPPALYR